MAQRVQIILEDDYDGGTADETVSFALDGAEYEIDLSSKNATGLRDALAPWVSHARKIGGRRKRATAVLAVVLLPVRVLLQRLSLGLVSKPPLHRALSSLRPGRTCLAQGACRRCLSRKGFPA